jgi:hypothetical protein
MKTLCEVCKKGGTVHQAKLVAPGELRKNYVAQAMKDPQNRAFLCDPCHLALNVLVGRAKPDDTTSPILIIHRPKLDELIMRRNKIRQGQLQSQMYLSFGKVESTSHFKGRLEGTV